MNTVSSCTNVDVAVDFRFNWLTLTLNMKFTSHHKERTRTHTYTLNEQKCKKGEKLKRMHFMSMFSFVFSSFMFIVQLASQFYANYLLFMFFFSVLHLQCMHNERTNEQTKQNEYKRGTRKKYRKTQYIF